MKNARELLHKWLRSQGRGSGYSVQRGIQETALRAIYHGDWPARMWACWPGACDVVVQKHSERVLPRGCEKKRIVFLSDLHLGPTTPASLLQRAFEIARQAEPDLLALGGDYVFLDATEEKANELTALIRSVGAEQAVAVLGNHDLWTSHPTIERALGNAGVTVLVNDAFFLDSEAGPLAVLGLDDPWTGQIDVDQAMDRAAGAPPVLALCHSPDGAVHLKHRGVPLLLVGHTHGGQIAAPGPRPIVVPCATGRRWPFGRHEVGEMTLLVSRGIGGVEVPVRLNAPPDLLVIDLLSPSPP